MNGVEQSTENWTIEDRRPILKNYILFYNTHGYYICDNDKYEPDFNKIAIYVDDDGYVNHASKQYKNMWRSKLGFHDIIEHKLEWLSGYDYNNYGRIGAIMRKKNKIKNDNNF